MADEIKTYTYLDFLLALKDLSEEQATLAFGDFMRAMTLGKSKQEVYVRWIEAARKITSPYYP